MKRIILSTAIAIAMSLPAMAQHAGHADPQQKPDLPPICLENAGDAAAMPAGHDMGGTEARKALMAGMDKMYADMMAGGTATVGGRNVLRARRARGRKRLSA